MAATNFNIRNDSYRKLMATGRTYRVPRFQRDYSWGEHEWEDLWTDTLSTISIDGEPAHYMGHLVLQATDDREFDIIDGQQRLTTLSIVVLAGLAHIELLGTADGEGERSSQRLEGLRRTYIESLDPVSLIRESKLTLNRNNDGYYQTYLVPLKKPLPKRGFKHSEHQLRKAFEWFAKRIIDHAQGNRDQGLAVAQLIEAMSDKLFFTVITVTDQLNAYKVFETLNARGVRLSSTDLLKNYLFSVIHDGTSYDREMDILDDRWEQITARLGEERFPDFLRIHWISRTSFVRQADLFKEIRRHVLDRQGVFALLRNIEDDIDTYLALTQPESSSWPKDLQDLARQLKTFSVRQPLSLLLAARRCLADSEFRRLLRAIVVISFRYNVICNRQASEQERTYHSSAIRITPSADAGLDEILQGLKPVYPNDKEFQTAFASKSIAVRQSRNRRVACYILAKLDAQEFGTQIESDSSAVSLEHICPTSPEDGWADFTDEDIRALTTRLGNMVLLEAKLNREIGNSAYSLKRDAYLRSSYDSPRRLAEDHEEWTPREIGSRQERMARMATSIWRVEGLS